MAPSKSAAWYVISLRPRGKHAALRRAAAREGAGVLALSPWRIHPHDDAVSKQALEHALAASLLIFTSPAAVTAASALSPLDDHGQQWLAVGGATAAALRRAGIQTAQSPARMDSEGLLAVPALQSVQDLEVGLITAPAGRDLLTTTLAERGARIRRADVYRRVDVALPATALAQLRDLSAPACLLLSSAAAWEALTTQLPIPLQQKLKAMTAIAASPRLAGLAQATGFKRVVVAEGPRPAQLLAAAARQMGHIR